MSAHNLRRAPSALTPASLLALAMGLGCGQAWAGVPIELPPGEDPATWREALELGRELVPDLELGLAIGPGPGVRVLARDDGWLLDIRTPSGSGEPLLLPAPASSQDRLELLLVCADALDGVQSPAQPEPPTAVAGSWAWGPPLLAGGIDLLPDHPRPVFLLIEPISLLHGGLALAPALGLAFPTELDPQLQLRTTRLTLDARWQAGRRLGWSIGAAGGVELRDLRSTGSSQLRDWTPSLGVASDLSLDLAEGWRVHGGLRFSAALPPAVAVWQGADYPLPTFNLMLTVGLAPPWPSSSFEPMRSKQPPPATVER